MRRHSFLEFLVLYGWVILLILFVFSILAYLGIINEDYVEEVCVFTSDIECVEYYASNNLSESVIVLRNIGQTKNLLNLIDDPVDDCDSPTIKACLGSVCQPQDIPFEVQPNQIFLLHTECVNVPEGVFTYNPVINLESGESLEGKMVVATR